MKIYAIIAQKGGTGKTTLAVNLAVAAERAQLASAVIDLDPQASATVWKDLRTTDAPFVVSAQAARLPQVLETARKANAGLVVIDTAPHSENTALAAARSADLIIIPCRPAIFDLRAITNTIDLANIAKKPAAIVFNAVPTRGDVIDQAREALEGYKVPICPHFISQRSAFAHSLTVGQGVQEYDSHGKAALEITAVYEWLLENTKKR